MMRNQIYKLRLLVVLLPAVGCSTYKQNGKCYDYKPLGCLYMNARLVCEVNAEGCETCNCIPFQQGKEKPPERREAW
jgi:hypothetical protein